MKRNSFIDILKGIGITSIVIGNSCVFILNNNIPAGPFVYTYHLMIFMFIIGYLFDCDKFEKDKNYKYQYIGKQIVKMLSLYFMYNMLVAKLLFIILYSKNVFNHRQTNIISIGILSAIIGSLLIVNKAWFSYYIHISIISISFICLGILYKKYEEKISRFVTTWSWMPSAIIIFIILKQYTSWIDLSANMIINPPIFYLLSILGIYFCLSVAKTIDYFKNTKIIFEIIGKNSFHIMAMHFMIIKFIDITYAYLKGIKDYDLISIFPYSFSSKLWFIYIILGVFIPIIIITPFKKFKEKYIDTMKIY